MNIVRYDCKDLYGQFTGKCVVIGCGISAPLIQPYIGKVFTIGVNDAFSLGDIDMVLVNDAPYRWTNERLEKMFECRTRFFCSRSVDEFLWVNCGAFVDYKLTSRNEHGLDDDSGRLGNNRTTLYAAVCLAYHLGFREIGMIGNDFVDNHFYRNDGKYNLTGDFDNINKSFMDLEHELNVRGCSFVNLSEVSRIDVTKRHLEEWIN